MDSHKTLRVGLTGGIGTGKSETLKAFKRAGAAVFSADRAAHALSRKGAAAYRAVVRLFGDKILDARGEIDRRALGERIFLYPALRKRLEKAIHPLILRQMRHALRRRRGVVVADVPLLYEAGLAAQFDAVIVVSCSRRRQIARAMKRDKLSRPAILRRLKAQWPLSRKEKAADVVIRNEGKISDLYRVARQYQKAFELMAGG